MKEEKEEEWEAGRKGRRKWMTENHSERGEVDVVFTFSSSFQGWIEEMDFYCLRSVGETKMDFATKWWILELCAFQTLKWGWITWRILLNVDFDSVHLGWDLRLYFCREGGPRTCWCAGGSHLEEQGSALSDVIYFHLKIMDTNI